MLHSLAAFNNKGLLKQTRPNTDKERDSDSTDDGNRLFDRKN